MTTEKEIRLFFLWKQEKYIDNKYKCADKRYNLRKYKRIFFYNNTNNKCLI